MGNIVILDEFLVKIMYFLNDQLLCRVHENMLKVIHCEINNESVRSSLRYSPVEFLI